MVETIKSAVKILQVPGLLAKGAYAVVLSV